MFYKFGETVIINRALRQGTSKRHYEKALRKEPQRGVMNKRIIGSIFTGLVGVGFAFGSLCVEPLGAATTAKKTAAKPKAPKKVPTKASPKASPTKVATNPKNSTKTERLVPLGTPANLNFLGPNGKWILRITSAPTSTAGRWPDFEPQLPAGRAWFSVAVEVTNLNAETEAFPAFEVGFFLTDSRSENVHVCRYPQRVRHHYEVPRWSDARTRSCCRRHASLPVLH
jgi:hypothetical protein